MVLTHPMTRENFIGGLISVVVHHDHDQTIKNKALKLLLFTGILDDDLQRVRFAMDNGARADWGLDSASKRILTNMGWTVPVLEPNPESLGADEMLGQSLPSDEAFHAD